jgi:hypothetical protein
MKDFEILSLAYQRQASGDVRELSAIIEEVRADLAAMQPPGPGPSDEIGFKSEVIAGVRKNYKIMGDGSQVEVAP